jgi:hypothetical protein
MRVDSLLPVQATLVLIVPEEVLLFAISKTKVPQVIIVLVVVMQGEAALLIKLNLAVMVAPKFVLMDLGVIAQHLPVLPQRLPAVEIVLISKPTVAIVGRADMVVAVGVVVTEVVSEGEQLVRLQELIVVQLIVAQTPV